MNVNFKQAQAALPGSTPMLLSQAALLFPEFGYHLWMVPGTKKLVTLIRHWMYTSRSEFKWWARLKSHLVSLGIYFQQKQIWLDLILHDSAYSVNWFWLVRSIWPFSAFLLLGSSRIKSALLSKIVSQVEGWFGYLLRYDFLM